MINQRFFFTFGNGPGRKYLHISLTFLNLKMKTFLLPTIATIIKMWLFPVN